jgi:hypothetical protein
MYPTTDEGYKKFLERVAAWMGAGQRVSVGVESTGNTRYFKGRTRNIAMFASHGSVGSFGAEPFCRKPSASR